jgi:hypothetical protein
MSTGLYRALCQHAPHVLEDLRDAQGEDPVSAWARRWRLDAPPGDWWAWAEAWWRELRRSWVEDPALAESLSAAGVPDRTTKALPGTAERAWCDAACRGYRALPDPRAETLNEWLTRAAQLYAEREGFTHVRRRPQRDHTDRFCGWLVQVHVLGQRPADVARSEGVDRAAVTRGVKQAATLYGITLREPGPGRPRSRC